MHASSLRLPTLSRGWVSLLSPGSAKLLRFSPHLNSQDYIPLFAMLGPVCYNESDEILERI